MGKINRRTDDSRTESTVQEITLTCSQCPGWKAGPFRSPGAADAVWAEHVRRHPK